MQNDKKENEELSKANDQTMNPFKQEVLVNNEAPTLEETIEHEQEFERSEYRKGLVVFILESFVVKSQKAEVKKDPSEWELRLTFEF